MHIERCVNYTVLLKRFELHLVSILFYEMMYMEKNILR